ncbi:MAG: hypothetical protein HOO86_10620 [Bacteroidales bacterium]|nr:hypothetical protein [Bacteroidales bacterium]
MENKQLVDLCKVGRQLKSNDVLQITRNGMKPNVPQAGLSPKEKLNPIEMRRKLIMKLKF